MERFDFGIDQPNAAGAFFAMVGILFYTLYFAKRKVLFGTLDLLFLSIASMSSYALFYTQSRGALFSLIASIGLVLVLILYQKAYEVRQLCLKFVLAVFFFTLLLVTTDFKHRLSIEEITVGTSTTYRLDLWQSGLNMIFLKPYFGWGIGQSGETYMQWFQKLDHPHRVAGMINSYLHVATERGLILFSILLYPIVFLWAYFLLNYKDSGRNYYELLHLICLAILSVFLMCNVFSSLWIFWKLWLLILLILIVCIYSIAKINTEVRLRLLKKTGVLAFVLVALFSSLLYGLGLLAHRAFPNIKLQEDYLVFNNSDANDKERWFIATDTTVMGSDYGKQIRQLFKRLKFVEIWTPKSTNIKGFPAHTFDRIIFIGKSNESVPITKTIRTKEIIYINPFFDRLPTQLNTPTFLYSGALRKPKYLKLWKSLSEQSLYFNFITIPKHSDFLSTVWIQLLLEHAHDNPSHK